MRIAHAALGDRRNDARIEGGAAWTSTGIAMGAEPTPCTAYPMRAQLTMAELRRTSAPNEGIPTNPTVVVRPIQEAEDASVAQDIRT